MCSGPLYGADYPADCTNKAPDTVALYVVKDACLQWMETWTRKDGTHSIVHCLPSQTASYDSTTDFYENLFLHFILLRVHCIANSLHLIKIFSNLIHRTGISKRSQVFTPSSASPLCFLQNRATEICCVHHLREDSYQQKTWSLSLPTIFVSILVILSNIFSRQKPLSERVCAHSTTVANTQNS